MENITGTGTTLRRRKGHPYINQQTVNTLEQAQEIINELNANRDNARGPNVEVDYYMEVLNNNQPMEGLKTSARDIMEHGTLKPWHKEADSELQKPAGYDENMSWITDIKLLGYNKDECVEAGLFTIAYPLAFFDKTPDNSFPLAQFMMAAASEPYSAFLSCQGAKIADIKFPAELKKRFPGIRWPHRRVQQYLDMDEIEPIIGTIVKPKTGLTPELFSRCVVEAALAGARFTKADENHHLALKEIPVFVSRTVKDLQKAGFDLGKPGDVPKGKRFLFAPHITADEKNMAGCAKAAVEAGANVLMFSPYYAGGFSKMAEIAQDFDVPIYAHTAGMNVFTGASNWGFDPRIMYMLAAYFSGAFMQLTAVNGYLRPDDTEKTAILTRLKEENLEGNEGMTLVIAGGLGPKNIGINMKKLGTEGRMFLAGTSVYSHPDGAAAGVKAIIQAYQAFREKGIIEVKELVNHAKSLGKEGLPLLHACA